jgi:hypothetical protein
VQDVNKLMECLASYELNGKQNGCKTVSHFDLSIPVLCPQWNEVAILSWTQKLKYSWVYLQYLPLTYLYLLVGPLGLEPRTKGL